MGAVSFREVLEGPIGARELDVNQGLVTGAATARPYAGAPHRTPPTWMRCSPTAASPAHARGTVSGELLGGRCAVLEGSTFRLLQPQPRAAQRAHALPPLRQRRRRRAGHRQRLQGRARRPRLGPLARHVPSAHVRLLRGHLDEEAEDAAGPRRSSPRESWRSPSLTFLRLVAGMEGDVADRLRFGEAFFGALWGVYHGRAGSIQDAFADPTPDVQRDPAVVRRRCERAASTARWCPFRAGDGLPLRLGTLPRRRRADARTGDARRRARACASAIFASAPQPHTMVDALVRRGLRRVGRGLASVDRLPADAATRSTTRRSSTIPPRCARSARAPARTASRRSCTARGRPGFTISALAGLVDDVRTVVSNAVSLHPVVTPLSKVKLSLMTPVASRLLDGVDPQWAIRAPSPLRLGLAKWVHLMRHDCDEPACAMSTYIYGYGPDVLWRHANLDSATHHWVSREFGYVPFSFFRQIMRSVKAGHLVPVGDHAALPGSYVDRTPPQEQLWTFVGGEQNRCFIPEGQDRSHAWFRQRSPQDHRFVGFPGYSHLDVFFGRAATRGHVPAHPRGAGARTRSFGLNTRSRGSHAQRGDDLPLEPELSRRHLRVRRSGGLHRPHRTVGRRHRGRGRDRADGCRPAPGRRARRPARQVDGRQRHAPHGRTPPTACASASPSRSTLRRCGPASASTPVPPSSTAATGSASPSTSPRGCPPRPRPARSS